MVAHLVSKGHANGSWNDGCQCKKRSWIKFFCVKDDVENKNSNFNDRIPGGVENIIGGSCCIQNIGCIAEHSPPDVQRNAYDWLYCTHTDVTETDIAVTFSMVAEIVI
jgi:hypothetical protein